MFFVLLLSKFKDAMNLLGLSFILFVLKLPSGSGFHFSLVCSKSLFFAKDEEKADHNVSSIVFTLACEWPGIFNTRKRYPEKNRRCIHAFTGESFSIWFYGQHNVYTIQVKTGSNLWGAKFARLRKETLFIPDKQEMNIAWFSILVTLNC